MYLNITHTHTYTHWGGQSIHNYLCCWKGRILLFYGSLNIQESGKIILNGRQIFKIRSEGKWSYSSREVSSSSAASWGAGRMYHHISNPWLPLLSSTMLLCFLKTSQKWTGSTGKRKLNNDLLNLKATSLHHMSLKLSQMKHSWLMACTLKLWAYLTCFCLVFYPQICKVTNVGINYKKKHRSVLLHI